MPSKVTKKRELKVVSEKFQSDIYIYKPACEVKLSYVCHTSDLFCQRNLYLAPGWHQVVQSEVRAKRAPRMRGSLLPRNLVHDIDLFFCLFLLKFIICDKTMNRIIWMCFCFSLVVLTNDRLPAMQNSGKLKCFFMQLRLMK